MASVSTLALKLSRLLQVHVHVPGLPGLIPFHFSKQGLYWVARRWPITLYIACTGLRACASQHNLRHLNIGFEHGSRFLPKGISCVS